jgi:hypothetical protein
MTDAGARAAQPQTPRNAGEFYCRNCGALISTQALACPRCGAPTGSLYGASPKERVVALLLCFFLGVFGAHRFYVGKIGTAILMILTVGGLGIWSLIDFIMIIVGSFTDKEGRPLLIWSY